MAELHKLLEQTRQIAERIRVLSEELQALRIKYRIPNERHERIGIPSDGRPSEEPSTQV